jgi:hypothetical protein
VQGWTPPQAEAVPGAALPGWPPSTNPTAPGPRGSAAADYDRWARGQRPAGRLYGNPEGPPPAEMTTSLSGGRHSPLEVSGSLTGHIIAQGRPDRPAPRRNIAKVAAVLVVILVILAAVSALVIFGVGDWFNDLFEGLIT